MGKARKGGVGGESGYSEDLSKVVFSWAGAGIGHLCTSAGFQLFLAEYLWLGLVHVLKAYGYTDLAGSQRKCSFLKQEVLYVVKMKFIVMDGHPQAKSQLCVKSTRASGRVL